MKLETLEKINKGTTMLAIGSLIFFMPMVGYMFGWAATDYVQQSSTIEIEWTEPSLDLIQPPVIEDVWAESVEGFKYTVSINDGIDVDPTIKAIQTP